MRTLARVRTLTALERLDPSRKSAVLEFLIEGGLVQRVDGRDPIISLRGTDLSGTDLSGARLSGARLSDADLNDAYLLGADLSDANLSQANLNRANLKGAVLSQAIPYKANLSDANLSDANLRGANLNDANLNDASGITNEKLEQQAASLEGATMPNGQKYENWLKSKNRKEGGKNDGSS